MLGDDVGDETLMAEDARSTLLFQLSFIGGSELPDLEQCAREDAEMQRRTAHAIVAREEARQQDESQDDADLEQTMADWRHAQQQRRGQQRGTTQQQRHGQRASQTGRKRCRRQQVGWTRTRSKHGTG